MAVSLRRTWWHGADDDEKDAVWATATTAEELAHPVARATGMAGRHAGRDLLIACAMAASAVVAGASLYLSLQIHTLGVTREAQQLSQELSELRQEQQQLEVQLARATSPAQTETMARTLLAMDRPRHLEVVLLPAEGTTVPGGSPASPAGGRSLAVAAAPVDGAGSGARHTKPVASAREHPVWP